MRLPAVVFCLAFAGTASAQFPGGNPPQVRVQPQFYPNRPLMPGPGLYGPGPFQPQPLPQVGPQVPFPGPQVQALTLEQYSRVFTPTPGKHDVWLIHPCTRQPVLVCFTLPHCGKLERFEVNSRSIEIEFDRPDLEVNIEFRRNGTVKVEYDD